MSDMRFAANSAAAGAGLGFLVFCGFLARTAAALLRNGHWNDARSFLGFPQK